MHANIPIKFLNKTQALYNPNNSTHSEDNSKAKLVPLPLRNQ